MAKRIPGPRGWPLIGNVGQIDTEKLHVTFYNMKKVYGDIFQLSVFSKRIIVISDVGLLEKAFEFEGMCHRPKNYLTRIKHNSGYLDSDYTDSEVALRSSLMKAIAAVQNDAVLRSFGVKEFENFLTSLDKTEDISILNLLEKTAANQYSILITGIQADDTHSDAVLGVLKAMRNIYSGGKVSKLTMLPWLQYIPGAYWSAVNRMIQARDQLNFALVADAMKNHKPAYERGILQLMMTDEISHDQDEPVIEKHLLGCTIDLLFNAVIPTAHNAAFILLQSIKHPEMQQRIREEISEVRKNMNFTDITLENLPYMEAFVLECMRYLSITNVTVPHLVNEDTEVDGYLFPKGSVVFGDIFSIHHDEQLWDQPWTFNPDRFMDHGGKCLPKTDPLRKHIAHFGNGLRQCQGANIAMENISRCMIGIFSMYKVMPAGDADLPSSDPRDYYTKIVVSVPDFKCRLEKI